QRWQVCGGHAIGEAGSSLVELNEPGERGQPVEGSGLVRLLPPRFEVRYPTGNDHNVARALAHHLVGDADVPASRVPDSSDAHGPFAPRLVSSEPAGVGNGVFL